MRISDWSSDVCSSDLNTSVFNVLQDHGMLQPTPENKAIWKATVTSESGWSTTFTFLRLSPALIWESGERPDLFSGTVVIAITLPREAAELTVGGSTGGARPQVGRASCRERVGAYR